MNNNVLAVLLLVLSAGVSLTYTKPKYLEVQVIKARTEEYQTAIKDANEAIALRTQNEQAYASISDEDKDRLAKMIPKNVDIIRLILDVNNIASRHGIQLKGINATADNKDVKPQTVVQATPGSPGTQLTNLPTPQVGKIKLSFSATTGYQQYIDFLTDVENSVRILDTSKLTVAPIVDKENSGNFNISTDLTAYYLSY